MTEIIPAILVKDETAFLEKSGRVPVGVRMVQLDVMDGKFVANTTWADPARMKALRLAYAVEAHLMVADPATAVATWCDAGAVRVIVHVEAAGWQEALAEIRRRGIDAGVAINPETALSMLDAVRDTVQTILVMGVTPGWSGQKMHPGTIARVRAVREAFPSVRIEVDGGVTLENARELASAGANGLVVASALFETADITETYNAFEAALSL